MRTLVVSDLHLGARTESDVLRHADRRAGLLEELPTVERLVLLGDTLELRHGPMRHAFEAARPTLTEIGAALPAGAEVVIVAGNHDHHLFAPWLERRVQAGPPAPLGLESDVAWWAAEPLGELARWLAPARVRAAYPGVWLRDDVYAIHGHYSDRHTTVPMLERLGSAATARVAGDPPAGRLRAEDYERALAPVYAWIHELAQHGGVALRGRAESPSTRVWHALGGGGGRRTLRSAWLRAVFPLAVAVLNLSGFGPLQAEISGVALRRAGLAAFAEVVTRLGIAAPHVIFGHTHRAGPLPGDDLSEWVVPRGPRLLNTGSWLRDPGFLGPTPARSPYRPGFAVRVADAGPPELVNVLDSVHTDRPGVKHTA